MFLLHDFPFFKTTITTEKRKRGTSGSGGGVDQLIN